MLQAIFVDGVDAITVSGLTQWDTGQKLEIKLASLPATFQVHFANKRDTTAYVVEGKATNGVGVVSIPNVILQKSVGAKAWIYVIDSNSAETIKTIELPIIPRAKPSDYAYEETEILNYETVIAKAEVLAEAAAQSEANAQTAATTALEAAQTAENAKVYVNTIVAGNEAYTKRESDLKYAPTISVGVNGTSIVVQDSTEAPLQDLIVYGKSEQAKTNGYQLLNIPDTANAVDRGLTLNVANGVCTVTGTTTITDSSEFNLSLWGSYVSTSALFTLQAGTYTATDCYIYSYDGTTRNVYKGTFTLTKSINVTWVSTRVYKPSETVSETLYPMLNEGSTAKSWEMYSNGVASPSPDYPQDIVSVGDTGSLAIASCGKNLLNHPAVTGTTNNGITYTVNDDMSITCSGTSTNYAFISVNVVLDEGTYILSGCPNGGNPVDGYCNFISMTGEFDNHKWDTGKGVTFTITKSGTYTVYICRFTPDVTVSNLTFYPMLCKAEIADSTYEPYKGTSITIPLAEPLRGIDSVKDEITQQNGVYGVYRRFGAVVFDGSDDEGWYAGLNQYNEYRMFTELLQDTIKIVENANIVVNMMCTHYVVKSSNATWLSSEGICCDMAEDILVYDKKYQTLDEFKAMLAEKPMTVVYELAAPIFEPFDEETSNAIKSLMSYKPVTTIYNSEGAEMDVEYSADTKIYIDNKFTELQAALISAGANV